MSRWKDVSYALTNIRSTLGPSSLVVIIMAFGIGISMTMFAFVKGVLWNDMGFAEEERVVSVKWDPNFEAGERYPRNIRIPDFHDLKEDQRSFEELVGYFSHSPSFNFGGSDGFTELHRACSVTHDFFNLLGVGAYHGRTFVEEDTSPGHEKVVVLSYTFWQDRFAGDLDVINSIGRIDGSPSRIIGIMPKEFSTFPENQLYWIGVDFQRDWGAELTRDRRERLNVIGLLNEGVTVDQATADLESTAARLREEFPVYNKPYTGVRVLNYAKGLMDDQTKTLLFTLLGCGAMVLLVACANVSNLMLARAGRRSFELAIRNSLGASRSHIMYQVILDGALLTFMGGLGGLVIAHFGTAYVWSVIVNYEIPFWMRIELDTVSVVVALGTMAVASIVASVIPAFRSARKDSYSMLRDDSRTSSSLFMGRISKILVGAQIALALALTLVAIVMVTIQGAASSQERLVDDEKILLTSFWYGEEAGFPERSNIDSFQKSLRERLLDAGAVSVGYFKFSSLGDRGQRRAFELPGETYENRRSMPVSGILDVTPTYFETFGFSEPISGRLFSDSDTMESEHTAIINRAFATEYFPNEDPVGKELRVPNKAGDVARWLKIVGVVDNYVQSPVVGESWKDYAVIYRPFSQHFHRYGSIAAIFPNDGNKWISTLRREMDALSPESSPNEIKTLKDHRAFNDMFLGLLVNLFIAFGVVSFLVASIGLYAVVSFSASQRIREFGIRMALGGTTRDIVSSVVRAGVVQALCGLVFGLAVGQALTQLVAESMDLGALPSVWITSSLGVGLIVLASLASMLIPALKAARLDPVAALRQN